MQSEPPPAKIPRIDVDDDGGEGSDAHASLASLQQEPSTSRTGAGIPGDDDSAKHAQSQPNAQLKPLTEEAKVGKLGGAGEEYQRVLAYSIVQAGILGRELWLNFEMADASKFEDICVYYEKAWILIQSKLSDPESKENERKLTYGTMFGSDKTNPFMLLNYFIGFYAIEKKWKHGDIKNMIIFTNSKLDIGKFEKDSKEENSLIDIGNEMHALHKFSKGKHYRLKGTEKQVDKMIELLEMAFKKESKNIIEALINLFDKNYKMAPILATYHMFLNEILIQDGEKVMFSKKEPKHKVVKEIYKDLKERFGNEFESKLIPSSKMENFWSQKNEKMEIRDIVKKFFDKLVLSVGQPNVTELRQEIIDKGIKWMRTWVRPDVLGRMDKIDLELPSTEIIEYFKEFENNIKENKRPYLKAEDFKKISEGIKKRINDKAQKHTQRTTEPNYIPRKFSYYDKDDSINESDFIKSRLTESENQCYIFSAQPGMGKTTLMQNLAFETQKTHPDNPTVFLIYLNHFRDEISIQLDEDSKCKKDDLTEDLIEQFENTWKAKENIRDEISIQLDEDSKGKKDVRKKTKITKQLEETWEAKENIRKRAKSLLEDILNKNIFKSELSAENVKFLVENSEKQIVIFFDAFDELKDENKKRILMVIEALRSKRNVKIIISGKKEVQEQLEKHLNVTAMKLEPLSKDDQIDYFGKIWKIDAKDKDKFKEFAHEILTLMFSELKQEFIGVPLTTWIVAEIFAAPVRQFFNSSKALKELITADTFNIIHLFETFSNESIRVMINKKYQEDKDFEPDRVVDSIGLKEIDYAYQLFAFQELFKHKDHLFPIFANRTFYKKFENQFQKYQSLVLECNANGPRFTHSLFRDYFAAKLVFKKCCQIEEQFLYKYCELDTMNETFCYFLLAMGERRKEENRYSRYVPDFIKRIDHHKRSSYLEITNKYGSKQVDQYLVELLRQENNGEYPLHTFVESNREDLVGQFLTEANSADNQGVKLLALAKSVTMVELLITKGAKLDDLKSEIENIIKEIKEKKKSIKLERYKFEEFVEILLYLHKNYQHSDHIDTVIEHIFERDDKKEVQTEMIKFLFKKGTNNIENINKNTALDFAIKFKNLEIVRYLIEECNVEKTEKFKNEIMADYLNKTTNLETLTKDIETCKRLGINDGEQDTALHYVAEKNGIDVAKKLIEQGANVNAQMKDFEYTPLHLAIRNKSYDVADFLLEKKVNLKLKNFKGNTVLVLAITRNYATNFIEKLIEEYKVSQISLDERNDKSKSYLWKAAEYENDSILELLIKKGATNKAGFSVNKIMNKKRHLKTLLYLNEKIDTPLLKLPGDRKCRDIEHSKDNFFYPLHTAARYGYKKVIKRLIDAGAKVNVMDSDGRTPLLLAQNTKIFDLLVLNHATENEKDKNKNTGLHIAAKNGNEEMVQYLIDRYPNNINEKNKDGQTALHLAMESGTEKIIRLLIENKANIHHKDDNGKSAICYTRFEPFLFEMVGNFDSRKCGELLFQYLHAKNIECNARVCDELIAKITDINTRYEKRKTFLHVAAKYNKFEALKVLIKKKGNVDTKDDSGNIPLHYACKKGFYRVVGLLADFSENINHTNKDGKTPLHLAIENDDNEYAAKVLLSKKAEINWTDNELNTCLHLAIRHERWQVALILINRSDKSDLNKRNIKGETVLHEAVLKNKFDIVKKLDEKGVELLPIKTKEHKTACQLAENEKFMVIFNFLQSREAGSSSKFDSQ